MFINNVEAHFQIFFSNSHVSEYEMIIAYGLQFAQQDDVK